MSNDNIDELLSDFDYVRWTQHCRMMMIRLVHGETLGAHLVLDRFAKNIHRLRVGMDQAVRAFFSARVANALESIGLYTVEDVDGAPDTKLIMAGMVGERTIKEVRDKIAQLKRSQQFEDYGEAAAGIVEPELAVQPGEPYGHLMDPKPALIVAEPRQETTIVTEPKADGLVSGMDGLAELEFALMVLERDPSAARQQVADRLEKLRAEVKKLERIHGLLAAIATDVVDDQSETADGDGPRSWEEITELVYLHVKKHGPAKPKAIGLAIGESAITVGRSVGRDERLTKYTDGTIGAKS